MRSLRRRIGKKTDVEDIESTLQQQNVGPGNERGSGEWPDPDTAPDDVAPGTDPVRRELIERERRAAFEGAGTTASQPAGQQDGRQAGTPGPARSAEIDSADESRISPPEGFKEALNADRILGGSSSIPDDRVPDRPTGR